MTTYIENPFGIPNDTYDDNQIAIVLDEVVQAILNNQATGPAGPRGRYGAGDCWYRHHWSHRSDRRPIFCLGNWHHRYDRCHVHVGIYRSDWPIRRTYRHHGSDRLHGPNRTVWCHGPHWPFGRDRIDRCHGLSGPERLHWTDWSGGHRHGQHRSNRAIRVKHRADRQHWTDRRRRRHRTNRPDWPDWPLAVLLAAEHRQPVVGVNSGTTGAGWWWSGPRTNQGGPQGPAGPIANTVFFPPQFDPKIPGAVFWNPALGNTGLFVSPGIPGGSAG